MHALHSLKLLLADCEYNNVTEINTDSMNKQRLESELCETQIHLPSYRHCHALS